MKIIPFETKYRDDMIYMVLQAKDALGRVPGLNEDLLDIPGNYTDQGDAFWLALDERERVIGCVGYNSIPGTTEVRLHRLYVKASLKRQGIGTALLLTAEEHIRARGKTAVHVHLGGKEYYESRRFYPRHGYREYAPDYMKKELERECRDLCDENVETDPIDCGFTRGNKWFRYRAAAIIVEDGCVLLAGNERDDYLYSVGGGVHVGETAEEAVVREVYEETGVHYEVDRLAIVHENFFSGDADGGEELACHEVALYFLMKPRGSRELNSHSTTRGVREFMVWVPIGELGQRKAFPTFLKERLEHMEPGIAHIVTYD